MAGNNQIETPTKLRHLQRTLYQQAKKNPNNGQIDSKLVNHTGKPDAVDPHVRFDVGDWTLAVQSLLY
jgi:hypothetical protein